MRNQYVYNFKQFLRNIINSLFNKDKRMLFSKLKREVNENSILFGYFILVGEK